MTPGPGRYTSLDPDALQRAPMRTEAGHCRAFEETWAWLAPVLPLVPVSRIYDATPLDVLGVPVWSAVTPLAKDLTVHAGKGATASASRLSAAMEAVERVTAESLPEERIRTASYKELVATEGTSPLDPRQFALPFQSTYEPDRPISWTGAYDLINGDYHWVPADLVITPASEGVCVGTETNGLASGNTYTEAVLHALYELVERDALAAEEFYLIHHDSVYSPPRPVRLVDSATLPATSRQWVGKLLDSGLRVQIQNLTTGTSIPVFGVIIVDDGYPGADGEALSFAGYGADLDPARAVLRAVTEAAQAHTGVTLGARDEFEGMRQVPERAAMLDRRLEVLYGDGSEPFPDDSGSVGDVYLDLLEVVRRLRASGRDRCLVTELTRADFDVPVVRVLVPGLAAPYPDSSRAPTLRLLSEVI